MNVTRRPEHSRSLRVVVLTAVLVAVVAVALEGAADLPDAIAALLLLPLGAVVSYRRRSHDNTVIKLLLTVGAVLALTRFFDQLGSAQSVEDVRQPLANLFLAVQILHGFDLPQRRDLGFTLASSLTLVALAATSARTMAFGLVLLVYVVNGALASAALQRAAARDAAEDAAVAANRPPLQPVRAAHRRRPGGAPVRIDGARTLATSISLLRGSVAALLAGLLVFLLLPRTDASQFGGLPFQGLGGSIGGGRGVLNPGLPYGGQRPADGEAPAFNPGAYFGLAEYVDLRTRGELSHQLVLRVRANRPRFWRGMVFDRYERSSWTRSAEEPQPTQGIPAELPVQRAAGARYEPVVQTYELETHTPNLVFAAAEPTQVFHAGASVSRWDDGTLTTSAEQEPGIVYSVMSLVDVTPRAHLRGATGPVPEDIARRYLQLPDDLPARVAALGRRLTAGPSTPYTKAEAVEAWLGANVEYSLDPTAQPPGRDTVDWFLFEHQRGWCEPIASSMVMLLRAGGVPARLATGFAPGSRNPFSGWYEVRMSDAHAWAEVWVPGHDWVPFDPTGAVPEAVSTARGPRLALLDLVRWLRERIPAGAPWRLAAAARTLASPVVLVLVLGAVAGVAVAVLAARRRRPAKAGAFAQLEQLLAAAGVTREPWQTPREYVARVRLRRPDLSPDPLVRLLEREESRRYGTDPPTSTDDRVDAADLSAVRAALDPEGRTRRSLASLRR